MRWLLLVAALVLCIPARVAAHGEIVRTEPPDPCAVLAPSLVASNAAPCVNGTILAAAPTHVTIWYTERVRPFGGGIRVIGPNGVRVDQGAVVVDGTRLSVAVAAAERGTYTVRWTVLAEDTHPARGTFTFNIGTISPRQPAQPELGGVAPLGLVLQTFARSLHFVGFALGFGAPAFALFVLFPPDPLRRTRRWVRWGIVAMLVAGPLALLGQTGSFGWASMLDPAAVSDALDAQFGRVLGVRLAVAMLLWVILGVEGRGATVAALAVAGGGALLEGFSTHALSAQPAWFALVVSATHMLAMAAWLGGLVVFVAEWRANTLDRRELLGRWSRFAATAFGVLALTGGIMAWQQRIRPATIFANPYSLALVAKTIVVIAVLALVVVASRTRTERKAGLWKLEIAALVVVVGLAGLLLTLPPPR